jgi:hypothetical protein
MMKSRPIDQSNRRQAERRDTCLAAQISYGPKDSVTLACTIRNLSSGGALLDLPEGALLPPSFRLLNIGEGFAYEAKIVWRRGGALGVAFTKTTDLHSGADVKVRALRALWEKLRG